MGLLDEAIREHLDLKRRRGADPADVERAEREALGPVRRAPTSQSVEVADQQSAEDGFAYDHDEELGWSGDPRDAPERAPGSPARDRELEPDFDDRSFLDAQDPPEPAQRPSRLARIFGRTEPEPEPEPELVEPQRPRYDEPDFDDPEYDEPLDTAAPTRALRPSEPLDPLEEPDSYHSTPPPHPAGGLGEETTEYEIEPAPGSEPPADGEDVLEETPEFLQDTPDHDRLWFEQRPPKDFDFDG